MERFSKQREKILEVVVATKTHPTADWIYQEVRKTYPNVSLGTVYRNLGLLVEQKMIRSYKFDGSVHYDGNTKEHHHFVCNECGKIQDIDVIDIAGKNFISTMEKTSHCKVSGYQMEMNGICGNCNENKKKEKKS